MKRFLTQQNITLVAALVAVAIALAPYYGGAGFTLKNPHSIPVAMYCGDHIVSGSFHPFFLIDGDGDPDRLSARFHVNPGIANSMPKTPEDCVQNGDEVSLNAMLSNSRNVSPETGVEESDVEARLQALEDLADAFNTPFPSTAIAVEIKCSRDNGGTGHPVRGVLYPISISGDSASPQMTATVMAPTGKVIPRGCSLRSGDVVRLPGLIKAATTVGDVNAGFITTQLNCAGGRSPAQVVLEPVYLGGLDTPETAELTFVVRGTPGATFPEGCGLQDGSTLIQKLVVP